MLCDEGTGARVWAPGVETRRGEPPLIRASPGKQCRSSGIKASRPSHPIEASSRAPMACHSLPDGPLAFLALPCRGVAHARRYLVKPLPGASSTGHGTQDRVLGPCHVMFAGERWASAKACDSEGSGECAWADVRVAAWVAS